MINVDVSLTGSQIANALSSDAEETAYMLAEMVNNIDGDEAEEIEGHLPYGTGEDVVAMLRLLADVFDPPKETQ